VREEGTEERRRGRKEGGRMVGGEAKGEKREGGGHKWDASRSEDEED
jgi:hypothetical protein